MIDFLSYQIIKLLNITEYLITKSSSLAYRSLHQPLSVFFELIPSTKPFFHLYTHIETRRYRVLKIGVYSDLGKQHANSILLSISKHFSGQKIELYDSNSQYDLIVCTDISEEFTVPFVTISDFLTEEDFKNIYKAIFIDNNEFLHQRKLI